MNNFWNNFRRSPHDGCFCMFYVAINYNIKTNVKVAASSIKIKTHQLLSKQQILDVRVTIVQREISVDLTRTCS